MTPIGESVLGRSGIRVSRLGLGCVTFGREIDERKSFEMMDYAVSHGIRYFDTAASYGAGESERIIGRWLRSRGCRDQIVLQTKVKPPFTREHIQEALSRSMERLGIEHCDIYLLHEFDPSVPLEVTMEALTAVVDSRRVGAIGCSNFTAEQLRAAESVCERNGFTPLGIVQPVYNLVARDIESSLLPYCRMRRIGVASYSPLAAGFLTGKYSNRVDIPKGTRFDVAPGHRDHYFKQESFAIVEKLRALAESSGATLSHLALGWVLANSSVDSILIGGTSTAHIRNAVEALQFPLDPNLIQELERLSSAATE